MALANARLSQSQLVSASERPDQAVFGLVGDCQGQALIFYLVVKGRRSIVRMALEGSHPADGSALICCSQPAGDLVLDL